MYLYRILQSRFKNKTSVLDVQEKRRLKIFAQFSIDASLKVYYILFAQSKREKLIPKTLLFQYQGNVKIFDCFLHSFVVCFQCSSLIVFVCLCVQMFPKKHHNDGTACTDSSHRESNKNLQSKVNLSIKVLLGVRQHEGVTQPTLIRQQQHQSTSESQE